VDLSHLQSIDFLFGPGFGSPEGRMGFDDLTLNHQ
jgi:hypothetical protein